MPIREFKCAQGHVTEKVLLGDKDTATKSVKCEAEFKHDGRTCGLRAKRIEIPSSSSILSEKTKFLSDVRG